MAKDKKTTSDKKVSNKDRLAALLEQRNQLEVAMIKITGAIELLQSMESNED